MKKKIWISLAAAALLGVAALPTAVFAEETEKETEKTGNFFSDLSQTSKILLGILGGMIVLLLILLFALHRKENK